MVGISNGARPFGAPALGNSLQLGAASIGSLDPATGVVGGPKSSYALAKGPLFFSQDGGGGGDGDRARTIPGALHQHLERPDTDTPVDKEFIVRPPRPELDEVKELMGLKGTKNPIVIDRKLSEFSSRLIWEAGEDENDGSMMNRLDKYHRAYNCFDVLLDDSNADIVLHAARYMSQTVMTSEIADARYPGSNMTYKGKFFRKLMEMSKRHAVESPEETTPMAELVRSLGTDINELPDLPTQRLFEIIESEDRADFVALVKAISAEAASFDATRSASAAIAFVMSARLIEDPLRQEKLTNSFLGSVELNAALFRDVTNYWTPMAAISDTASILLLHDVGEKLDLDRQTMYMNFVQTIIARGIDYHSAFAVPAVFHLAAKLEDEERVEELPILARERLMYAWVFLQEVMEHIRGNEWKFTRGELAIADKGAQRLKI